MSIVQTGKKDTPGKQNSLGDLFLCGKRVDRKKWV